MKRRHHPKAAQGSKRLVEISCVAWVDLLGYGAMLREGSFDPTDARTQAAVERLNAFHEDVARHSTKYSPSVVMNDGAAIYRDLSPRTGVVTFDFLRRCLALHEDVNTREMRAGLPGARMFIASGFRVRRPRRRQRDLADGIGAHLVRAVETGRKQIKEAVLNAITIKPFFDVVPELQANFAFSKAYLADRTGSSGGFRGPYLFLERCVLAEECPTWIEVSDEIAWSTPGISTSFVRVLGLDEKRAGKMKYAGALDAFQIADRISASKGVVTRLRSLRLRKRPTEFK